MTDDPTNQPPSGDKTPDAIKKHKEQQTLEFRGPGGSAIRQAGADALASKPQGGSSLEGTEKSAKTEQEKIVLGEPGVASGAFNKAAKDQDPVICNRAEKYAKIEKEKIVLGEPGVVSKEFNKAARDTERDR